VREHRQSKQQHHVVAYLLVEAQPDDLFHTFVQHDYAHNRDRPHFERVVCSVKVHVLVPGDTRFVWT